MGVVIETIRRVLGLVIIVTVVACGRLLLGPFADDVKLLACQLNDLLQRLFQIHVLPSLLGRVYRR